MLDTQMEVEPYFFLGLKLRYFQFGSIMSYHILGGVHFTNPTKE